MAGLSSAIADVLPQLLPGAEVEDYRLDIRVFVNSRNLKGGRYNGFHAFANETTEHPEFGISSVYTEDDLGPEQMVASMSQARAYKQ